MRIQRTSSALTVSITILTAGLLIATTLQTPPNRSSSVQAATHNTGPRHASSPQPPSGYKAPLAEQRLAGGYWRVDYTFQPVLILTNFLQNMALPVTPLLYAADGTEYRLPEVTLPIAGVSSIDIRAAISAAPDEIKSHFSDYGSAALEYVWHSSGAVSALVVNRDVERSLNFNFEFKMPMAMQHGASVTVQEGLWWREDSHVKGFLALVNIARRPVDVQVQVLSDYGAFESEKIIHLQVNETRKLDVLEDTHDSSGGIQVRYDGSERDIVLAGGLENPQEGYSAQIPFLSVSPQTKPSSIAISSVGLILGVPDPMMKCPSGTQFGIYLALRNTTSRPISVIPTLYYMEGANVRKSDLNTLSLAARQAKHWTPQQLATELGLPKLSGMVNLVFSYQGSPSDVIMANGSIDQTKNYVFEIIMKAVGKSQAKGLKDWDVSNGNDTMISLLNPDEKDEDLCITFYFDGGHYKLRVHLNAGGSAMFNMSDIIMMQQADPDGNKIPPGTPHGTAILTGASDYSEWINVGVSVGIFNVSTATCGGRCPNCSTYSDFEVLPNNSGSSTALVGSTANFQSWGFAQDGLWHNVTFASSWSSDNGIVATSSGSGSFTGVNGGSFDAVATAGLQYGNSDCTPNGPCPTTPFGPASAPGTIQKPTSLKFLSLSVLPTGTTGAFGCPPNSSGIRIDIKYQVLDQNTTPIQSSAMTPHEAGTLFSGSPYDNNVGPVANYPTSGLTTASDGTFHDVPFGACVTGGTFSSLTATQNLSMLVGTSSFPVRTQTWTVTGTTLNHGTITNGTDVSASR
jgi:hypothetical protein